MLHVLQRVLCEGGDPCDDDISIAVTCVTVSCMECMGEHSVLKRLTVLKVFFGLVGFFFMSTKVIVL